jgi:hypothetical protein
MRRSIKSVDEVLARSLASQLPKTRTDQGRDHLNREKASASARANGILAPF